MSILRHIFEHFEKKAITSGKKSAYFFLLFRAFGETLLIFFIQYYFFFLIAFSSGTAPFNSEIGFYILPALYFFIRLLIGINMLQKK